MGQLNNTEKQNRENHREISNIIKFFEKMMEEFNSIMLGMDERSSSLEGAINKINGYLEILKKYNSDDEEKCRTLESTLTESEQEKLHDLRNFNEGLWLIKVNQKTNEKNNIELEQKRNALYINRCVIYLKLFYEFIKTNEIENVSSKEKFDILKDGINLTSVMQKELLANLEQKESELSGDLHIDSKYKNLLDETKYKVNIPIHVLSQEERKKTSDALEQLLDNKQTYMEAFRENSKIEWNINLLNDHKFLDYNIEDLIKLVYDIKDQKEESEDITFQEEELHDINPNNIINLETKQTEYNEQELQGIKKVA